MEYSPTTVSRWQTGVVYQRRHKLIKAGRLLQSKQFISHIIKQIMQNLGV